MMLLLQAHSTVQNALRLQILAIIVLYFSALQVSAQMYIYDIQNAAGSSYTTNTGITIEYYEGAGGTGNLRGSNGNRWSFNGNSLLGGSSDAGVDNNTTTLTNFVYIHLHFSQPIAPGSEFEAWDIDVASADEFVGAYGYNGTSFVSSTPTSIGSDLTTSSINSGTQLPRPSGAATPTSIGIVQKDTGRLGGTSSLNNHYVIDYGSQLVTDLYFVYGFRTTKSGGPSAAGIQGPDFEDFLPASLTTFKSQVKGNTLQLQFTTASEESNIGFQLYGLQANKRIAIGDLIPSKVGSSSTANHYQVKLPYHRSFQELVLATVDTQAQEEFFGPYSINKSYGLRQIKSKAIDWKLINNKLSLASYTRINGRYIAKKNTFQPLSNQKLVHRYTKKLKRFNKKGLRSNHKRTVWASVPAKEPGFYEVSAAEILAAGKNFSNVPIKDIGVLFQGVPIGRAVIGSQKGKLADGSIIFHHDKLELELQRYNKEAVYEIVVDQKARLAPVTQTSDTIRTHTATYQAISKLDKDLSYDPALPNDGWFMNRIIRRSKNKSISYTLKAPPDSSGSGSILVHLLGVTDWPGPEQDHHARIYLNDTLIADEWSDGLQAWSIKTSVNTILPGDNKVTIELVNDTGKRFDIVNVESIELYCERPLMGNGTRLEFSSSSPGFTVSNIQADKGIFAKVEHQPYLYQIQGTQLKDGNILLPGFGQKATYAIGGGKPVQRIQVKPDSQRLTRKAVDLLVISHEVFSDHPKLIEFVSSKRAQGHRVKIVNIEDIFTRFGYGMRSIKAIQKFIKRHKKLRSVLLVGGDSYDYHNNLGSSTSFIPTAYTSTQFFKHVPYDGLLTDTDNDGWGNIAIGRWPVRTADELAIIIDRSLAYEKKLQQKQHLKALVLSEKDYSSYGLRTARILERIANVAVLSVDQIIQDLYPQPDTESGHSDYIQPPKSAEREALTLLKKQFKDELATGVDLISYGGHASATQWGRSKSLLHASEIDQLSFGSPVGLMMLACYTTDFVNPYEHTFVHQWMFSQNSIEGGAAFMVGASALSGYTGNLKILDGIIQKDQGSFAQKLQKKVQTMRNNPLTQDTAKTWNYLGDPTL